MSLRAQMRTSLPVATAAFWIVACSLPETATFAFSGSDASPSSDVIIPIDAELTDVLLEDGSAGSDVQAIPLPICTDGKFKPISLGSAPHTTKLIDYIDYRVGSYTNSDLPTIEDSWGNPCNSAPSADKANCLATLTPLKTTGASIGWAPNPAHTSLRWTLAYTTQADTNTPTVSVVQVSNKTDLQALFGTIDREGEAVLLATAFGGGFVECAYNPTVMAGSGEYEVKLTNGGCTAGFEKKLIRLQVTASGDVNELDQTTIDPGDAGCLP